jgi:outer membrane biosynthesis protein TonB
MVDAMPPMPRPQLPSAVRGGFLASVDWLFSATSLGSFIVFATFVVVLEGMDFPIAQQVEIPSSAVHFIMDEPAPPPDDAPVVADATSPDDASPTHTEAPDSDRPPTPDARRPNRDRASDSGEPTLADASDIRRAVMLQIGALAGESGTEFDNLIDGAPTTDAATLFADVDGVAPSYADASGMRPRDGCVGGGASCDSGRTGDIGRLVPSDGVPGPASEGDPIEEVILTIRPPSDPIDEPIGPGWFDHALVTAEVRRRVASIRRCYEHTLGARGDVSGKVTAEFTIHPAGNVSGVRAIENTTGTPRMAECVERSLRTLRFDPGPEGGSLTFRYPFVFAEQR